MRIPLTLLAQAYSCGKYDVGKYNDTECATTSGNGGSASSAKSSGSTGGANSTATPSGYGGGNTNQQTMPSSGQDKGVTHIVQEVREAPSEATHAIARMDWSMLIAIILLIAVLVALFILFWKKRRRNKQATGSNFTPPHTPPTL